MTLESYLKQLRDEGIPPGHSELLKLSGLSSDEASALFDVWPSIADPRRREIVARMVELSDDNPELDFTTVYLSMLKDRDPDVRAKAARGLWECDERVIIRPLLDLLTADPDAGVRSAAALTLGKFSTMAPEGKLLPRDAKNIQQALLSVIRNEGEDAEVRRRAIEAVAPFNTPEVEQAIRRAFASPDLKSKQSAIYAMGRSSDTQWLPTIVEQLDNEDKGIRYEAATACGYLGDESAVPHLIGLLDDDDLQVGLAAIRSLGDIGGPLARMALMQWRKSGDEALAEAAEEALSEMELEDDSLGLKFQL